MPERERERERGEGGREGVGEEAESESIHKAVNIIHNNYRNWQDIIKINPSVL